MNENVHWMLEVGIKDGELDNFKTLMAEMIETTQNNEPGAMNYEWFISEDGSTCEIYERYSDSAATMTHLASFGANFADRFMGCVNPTRFIVYGDPSSEVREALAAFGAVHRGQIGGFAR